LWGKKSFGGVFDACSFFIFKGCEVAFWWGRILSSQAEPALWVWAQRQVAKGRRRQGLLVTEKEKPQQNTSQARLKDRNGEGRGYVWSRPSFTRSV